MAATVDVEGIFGHVDADGIVHCLSSPVLVVRDNACSTPELAPVAEDDDVTSNKVVRQLEDRIRELERQLGRKTLEAEIPREALDKSRSRKPTLLARSPLRDDFQ